MSVNISKNFKLVAYSQPNYRGVSKTYKYPGVKDVSAFIIKFPDLIIEFSGKEPALNEIFRTDLSPMPLLKPN